MTLDTRSAISKDVRGVFSSIHARALSHATEDLEKVKTAMLNVLGDVELVISSTEGHHGNPIAILEAVVADMHAMDEFFGRLSTTDMEELISTLGQRVDDGCNLFLKLDKQEAYSGSAKLGSGDDVISARLKIRAFPAKPEVARKVARDYLSMLLESRV